MKLKNNLVCNCVWKNFAENYTWQRQILSKADCNFATCGEGKTEVTVAAV